MLTLDDAVNSLLLIFMIYIHVITGDNMSFGLISTYFQEKKKLPLHPILQHKKKQ